jgi:prolyl-tRNA editing enzyme YbaK/EbsC (Cys-tRNA(Pro) deacylase)
MASCLEHRPESGSNHILPRTAPVTFPGWDVRGNAEIRVAAGSPNAGFALTPDDRSRLTGAAFVDIAKR